jgi:hypothetical protein
MLSHIEEFLFGDQRRKYVVLISSFVIAEAITAGVYRARPAPSMILMGAILTVLLVPILWALYDGLALRYYRNHPQQRSLWTDRHRAGRGIYFLLSICARLADFAVVSLVAYIVVVQLPNWTFHRQSQGIDPQPEQWSKLVGDRPVLYAALLGMYVFGLWRVAPRWEVFKERQAATIWRFLRRCIPSLPSLPQASPRRPSGDTAATD